MLEINSSRFDFAEKGVRFSGKVERASSGLPGVAIEMLELVVAALDQRSVEIGSSDGEMARWANSNDVTATTPSETEGLKGQSNRHLVG